MDNKMKMNYPNTKSNSKLTNTKKNNKMQKPKTIIVDIDGTLAKMNGRGPFEWARVGEDLCKEQIKDIVNIYYDNDYTVIIFSGRDGICRPQTEQWLKDHNIHYNALYMRPAGNNEKDSIVKERMYRQYIEPYLDVQFILVDRDQVVKMWRDLGLTCLQVDYGNF
jgi:hypothetical protein